MYKISDFIVKKEDRQPGIQYMYYRIEGDGYINNGTTSQKERYSKKTAATVERWYDVSKILPVTSKDRPDDIFHNSLKVDGIYPVRGRDIFDPKDLDLATFEKHLVDFANEKIGANTKSKLTLRPYQEEGGKAVVDFINSNKTAFLLEAIMGYGKTYTTYYALQETNLNTIAIVTHRLAVNDAWIKDFKSAHLEKLGFALKSPEYTLGNWAMAKHRIILAPSRDNKVFKNIKADLWISDEAHLEDASKAAEEFYKDKRVLYVTATGDKLSNRVKDSFYVDLLDMSNWIAAGIIPKDMFIIPEIKMVTKFADWDFGKLTGYTDIQLAQLLDDIVSKSTDSKIIKNGMIKCQSRCANAYKLYQAAIIAHPEIKWYLSTCNKSFANGKQVSSGKQAIQTFDKDCKDEKNTTHILITVFQGKESYSYYDLYNVFHLCDKDSSDGFIQLSGRLFRPKQNTHETTATFYLYSPLVKLSNVIWNLYEKSCKKHGILCTKSGFDNFVRIFKVFVNNIPYELSATKVLNEIALHGDLLRNSNQDDWDTLCDFFGGNVGEGSSTFVNGSKTTTSSGSHKTSTKAIPVISEDEENTEENNSSERDYINVKRHYEEMANRLPFYFKTLEYLRDNPNKVSLSNQKHVKEILKDFKYPESVDDLRSFPIFNFLTIVYNFKDNQRVIDLFSRLSDTLLENLLKRIIAHKDTELKDLPYALYSPHTKNKVVSGRIEESAFDMYFIPKLYKFSKTCKILTLRIGIDAVLSLKKLGFSNIIYYTDIVSEKAMFDYYGIECKYVKQVAGKEDWTATIEGLDMQFDLIIMNPPYDKNLHLKVLSKAISQLSTNGEVINLSPTRWLQDPFAKYKKSSDYFRFEKEISKHIVDLQILSNKEMEEQFNIHLYTDLGIYTCNKIGGFKYQDIYKRNRSKLELRILNIIVKHDNIKNHMDIAKRDGIRVLLALIAGNRGNLPIYKDLSYVIDGYKDGKDWTECKQNGNYVKEKGSAIPNSIKFNTEIEATNFYNSYKTLFSRWLCDTFTLDQHIQVQFLPYMNDYTKAWTNKRFCDYFKITGYISDTEAAPNSEWEEILACYN